MEKDSQRKVWYLPSLSRKHWFLVAFLMLAGIMTGQITSILGFISSLLGTFVLVYIFAVLWSGITTLHRDAVEEVQQ